MADAVSKLYAEIGFKVNKDGLEEAKSVLEKLAEQFTIINKKASESAEKYGIFSKKQIQQRLKQNRELDKQNKIELSEQAKQNVEQERLYKQQLRIAEKAEQERIKQRKSVIRNVQSFSRSVMKAYALMSSAFAHTIGDSIGRATAFSKLQSQTGISTEDYQYFAKRAFSTGSGMTQQDVMQNIQNVSANLQKISLGQGSLSGYKLSNVVASARYGDIAGIIKNFEHAIKYGGIAPNMAYELGEQIGLSKDWIYSVLESRRAGGTSIDLSQEEIDRIKETGKAFEQARYGIQIFKDSVTATLAPALQKSTDVFIGALDSFAKHFKENEDFYMEKINAVAESFNKFIENLKPEDVDAFVRGFMDVTKGLLDLVNVLSWVGKTIMGIFKFPETIYNSTLESLRNSGKTIDTSNPQEAMKHIMFGDDSTWKSSLKPTSGNMSNNVYSPTYETTVNVESKSNNPYEDGLEIGRGIKNSTQEKIAHNEYNVVFAKG